MAPINTPQAPRNRPVWLAPAVLGLTLLAGASLHYWPDLKPGHARATDSSSTNVVGVKAALPVGPSAGTARKTRLHPALNTRVLHSEFCLDCESFYLVHDGKGGKIRRSEGYNTRCCQCGTTVAFSDGYYYDIICEGRQITAKMGKRVSDED